MKASQQIAYVFLEHYLKPGPTFAILQIVGQNWAQKFYQQYSEVKAVEIKAIDALRVCGANISQLTEWLETAKENLPGVSLYNIYNIEKTGIL